MSIIRNKRDYVIKLKWTKRLAQLAQVPNLLWHCITESDREHCDVTSIMYQATSWDKPRRVVIVRRLDIDPQECLCADWLWEYEAIATTLDWSGEDVWHFYNFRGNAEKHVALQPGVRQWTAGRLRRRLFHLPGILVRHARQWTIRLPVYAKHRSLLMLHAAT
ncbi:transposase [Alicyclobacillus acidoterrestris]|uniref:transposase n=1 Tax=Alicyclobacillus acidoterrestris TaxID=1450 RepID=UPI002ADD9560|nr:transposase [Alicyclobacillus acidoterrestris]